MKTLTCDRCKTTENVKTYQINNKILTKPITDSYLWHTSSVPLIIPETKEFCNDCKEIFNTSLKHFLEENLP